LGDDPIADRLVQLATDRGLKECASAGVRERADGHFWHAYEMRSVGGSSGRKYQYDRLSCEAARYEAQHLRRRAVDPLCIVHKADQRLRLGAVGEQAEHAHPNQESIGRRAARKSESGAESIALRSW